MFYHIYFMSYWMLSMVAPYQTQMLNEILYALRWLLIPSPPGEFFYTMISWYYII